MVRDHDRGVTFVDWAHATTGPGLYRRRLPRAATPPRRTRARRHRPTAPRPPRHRQQPRYRYGVTRRTHRPLVPAPPDCAPTSSDHRGRTGRGHGPVEGLRGRVQGRCRGPV
ncbi:hypothetical protein [Streptomyces mirabilis]|uniref:hypothetical protein n=1 Tax=Streptomyces mirabilis TaxID=68239 RepID=UPI00368EBB3F